MAATLANLALDGPDPRVDDKTVEVIAQYSQREITLLHDPSVTLEE